MAFWEFLVYLMGPEIVMGSQLFFAWFGSYESIATLARAGCWSYKLNATFLLDCVWGVHGADGGEDAVEGTYIDNTTAGQPNGSNPLLDK